MSHIQALSIEKHAGRCWQRLSNWHFAGNDAITFLVAQELPKASLLMPIAFIAQEERFTPVAVLGLTPGKNLFVAPDGRWMGGYVPASYRGYPFALANTEDGQQVLCVDEDSGLIGNEGEALFNEDGTPSHAVSDVFNFLSQVGNNRTATQRLSDLLQKHKLIQPWPIKVQADKGEQHVEGLFRIDEAALNQLPAEAILELRDSGALALVYCQLLSMQHLPMLGQLAQLHAQAQAQAAQQATASSDLDLEFLNSGGTITFGNLQ